MNDSISVYSDLNCLGQARHHSENRKKHVGDFCNVIDILQSNIL